MAQIQAADLRTVLAWFDEWWTRERTLDQRRIVLWVVWGGIQIPDLHLDLDKWLERFREVGFVSDLPGVQRPTVDVAVFRGAPRGGERGMSWTTSERIAQGFAERAQYSDQQGLVWRAMVKADAVLALIYQRGEAEVVVDPAGLIDLSGTS